MQRSALGLAAPSQEAEHRPGQLAGGEVAEPAEGLGHLVGGAGRMAGAAEPALDAADGRRVEPERGDRGVEQRVEQVVVDGEPPARRSDRRGSSHW